MSLLDVRVDLELVRIQGFVQLMFVGGLVVVVVVVVVVPVVLEFGSSISLRQSACVWQTPTAFVNARVLSQLVLSRLRWLQWRFEIALVV